MNFEARLMVSALDTNLLLDLLIPGAAHAADAQRRLDEAIALGALVICEVVYAELAAVFPDQADLDGFLDATGIRLEPAGRAALARAGLAWREYRRRRPGGLVCPACGAGQTVACGQCGRAFQPRQHFLDRRARPQSR
jgi:predicted nucleic acid-binding protein